ncbi:MULTISPECIES: D-alanine--D-alanine ligase [unclassified Virgibacillus]|uniref:D-alanine--D-alanine ligase n=1 Tax=unclassified Virgibacillus TaxID=2620237 RepID=UPI00090B887C|nr:MULTISPECIES: D-alanine--D-alanine ligase [unclassified Virgibacillus]API92876.1 D-alanine--D-alanine ligase A [Virgibacillus sp. 6R]MBS7428390.1 D-alanine--D-alanine ligase [Virgibacillus sp. 19R1-5]
MEKKKVGIIFGGKSAEHEVSLQSAKNIVDAIDRDKFEVVLIGIDKEGKWHLNEPSSYLLHADNPKLIQLNKSNETVAIVPGEKEKPFIQTSNAAKLDELDVVFPIVHGTLGEDGSLQGMLRLADLPFVGPDVLASSVCMDKDIAKRLLQAAGINVANGIVYRKNEQQEIDYETVAEQLGTPMFIKPANQGSSVGISKVTTEEEFYQGVKEAFNYDHKIVIEECIIGREIECSVLGNEEPKASLLGEILPQTEFYSYESKYIDEKGADLAIPADVSEETTKRVQEIAIQAFKVLECEGLARVDFFLTEAGEIYLNEVNTLPGFTKISMYPKLWEVSGLSYQDLITTLIELAIDRHKQDHQLKSSLWD